MQRNADSYYDNINLPLFESLPPAAGLVLEVGCGAGRLGAAYKARFPGSTYYGIEIDAKAAAVAAERLDLVMCGAAESFNLEFLTGKVDCIVYGDVLEHLVDPWALVSKHASLLSPTGQMVSSIPNIQNWGIILELMRGNWFYQDAGLLDRTHLRFFTLRTILQLFISSGLIVTSIVGCTADTHLPSADHFADRLSDLIREYGGDPNAFRERCKVFQYMVKASRP